MELAIDGASMNHAEHGADARGRVVMCNDCNRLQIALRTVGDGSRSNAIECVECGGRECIEVAGDNLAVTTR